MGANFVGQERGNTTSGDQNTLVDVQVPMAHHDVGVHIILDDETRREIRVLLLIGSEHLLRGISDSPKADQVFGPRLDGYRSQDGSSNLYQVRFHSPE